MASGPTSFPSLGAVKPLRVLAESARGQVYQAELPGRSSVIAVKVLNTDPTRDAVAIERFVEVCAAASGIRHPNVVEVIEAVQLGDGRVVVATEYLEGEHLGQRLGAAGLLDPDDALQLFLQVAEGLAAAHRRGVLHLALKPENVYLARQGPDEEIVKLLDFGIGILQDPAGGDGTPDRLDCRAPEQVQGDNVDARSDVYALGVMLYWALCGQSPFEPAAPNDDGAPRRLRRLTRPPGRPEVTNALGSLVVRCLAEDPVERYADGSDLAAALAALDASGVPVRTPDPGEFDEPDEDDGSPSGRREVRVCAECGEEYALHVQFCGVDGAPLPAPELKVPDAVDPLLGQTIGPYHVKRMIGEGGMGRVYLVEHMLLGRRVAMKILPPELSHSPQTVRRFFREARAVNQIAHDNIIEITDFVEEVGGLNYYIMEFLEGVSLHSLIKVEGSLPPDRAVTIAAQICDALAATHAAGIVHRDLKPENVFVLDKASRPDFVKLLDFGVAKLVDAVGRGSSSTGSGAVIGTPEYMAPEQAASGKVDHRADIYALGVMLYRMVTGRMPFEGGSFGQLLVMQMTKKPKRPSVLEGIRFEVSPAMELTILRCMAKSPDDRYQSMAQLKVALLKAVSVDAEPVEESELQALAEPEQPLLEPVTTGRSNQHWIALACAALALVGLGALLLHSRANGGGEAAPQGRSVHADASPARVLVSFESLPAGAEVRRAGEVAVLGRTPCSVDLAPRSESVAFVFNLAGHQSMTVQARLERDVHLAVSLLPAPESAKPAPGWKIQGPPKAMGKNETVDPFGD